MSQRVLVTGVAGFLGSHLAEAFVEEGWEVVGNDDLSTGDESAVPEGVEFHERDCKDREGMAELMAGVDLVYHAAALPYEGLSVFSPTVVTRSIQEATTATLAAAAASDVDRFVYCSSMSRYGSNEVPFTEDMEPRPQDPYAISKVAAERTTRVLADVHGFEYVIAVPHNIIGPRQRYDDPFRNVAAIFINRMLQGKQPIIYGDGEQMRCFTYVDDAVRALAALGRHPDAAGEVVNVGPDREFVTINELAGIVADILDFDLDPIYLPDRPQEVKRANCSADKARELVDYHTEYTLREGLERTVEWIREQGPKPFDYHIDIEIPSEDVPATWADERM